MKKLLLSVIFILLAASMSAQVLYTRDLTLKKAAPILLFDGLGGVINLNNNIYLTQSTNKVTLSGGILNMTNNFSIGDVPLLPTITQLNYLSTVISDVQVQINSKVGYPAAGIPLSTGVAWGASITNNSANWNTAYGWGNHAGLYDPIGTGTGLVGAHELTYNHINYNTAYTDRLKWDGGATDLVAGTGRTSLGGTTVGQAFFMLANPSAITFPRIDAANTVTARSAANFKADLSLENVTNESKATMFTNSALTGTTTAVNISATGGIQGQGEFNVIQYGAITNDGNEDATAINATMVAAAAWSAAHQYMGATVRIPAGYWYIMAGIELKSYVHVKVEPGALFYFPGAYAGNMWQVTAGNTIEFASVDGGFYGEWTSTRTWNCINLASNDNLKFITGCKFTNMYIQNPNIAINLVVTNDGWINSNNFLNYVIWRPVYAIKASQAVTGLGLENNVFNTFQMQCENAVTTSLIDLVNSPNNTFIACEGVDIVLPILAANIDATSYYNQFWGCDLGDNQAEFMDWSASAIYSYQKHLTNTLDLITWGSILSWYNGDVSITHSGNKLDVTGGVFGIDAGLQVGDPVSSTIVTTDSISYVDTDEAALYDGADTINYYIPYANRTEGVALADSSAIADPESYATGNMLEDGLALKLDVADSTNNAAGNYMTRQNYHNDPSSNNFLKQINAFGATIKGLPVTPPWAYTNSAVMVDGTAVYQLVYIAEPATITGVKWYMTVQGDYVADNNNYIGLYSISGTTYTQVAISANNGNLWKASVGSVTTAFSAPYTAAAGFYYIAVLWNTSDAPPAAVPTISTMTGFTDFYGLPNSKELCGTVAGQTELPASEVAADIGTSTSGRIFILY